MKVLLAAIQDKYYASALAPPVTNGLWLNEAPQGTPLPLITYQIVSDDPDPAWGSHSMDQVTMLFNIWQADTEGDETSGVERIEDLYGLFKTAFDECALTIPGYTHIRMSREMANLFKSLDGGWQYAMTYRILTQET